MFSSYENQIFFYRKIFSFLVVKFSIYLNRRVFVMNAMKPDNSFCGWRSGLGVGDSFTGKFSFVTFLIDSFHLTPNIPC